MQGQVHAQADAVLIFGLAMGKAGRIALDEGDAAVAVEHAERDGGGRRHPDHRGVYRAERPLVGGHAHNDYQHGRPLLSALDQGFTIDEAEVTYWGLCSACATAPATT